LKRESNDITVPTFILSGAPHAAQSIHVTCAPGDVLVADWTRPTLTITAAERLADNDLMNGNDRVADFAAIPYFWIKVRFRRASSALPGLK
jgi:hypothetical protein